MKHKVLKLIIMAFSLLFISCGQEKEPVSVTGISLSQASLELEEGDTQVLTATVSPSNADNKSVSWTSTQPAVASVQEGAVTAHKIGTATIIVTTVDGGKTAICEVRVSEKTYYVEQIILDKTSIELIEGEEATLSATIIPDNAINKNIIWASNNNDVATVVDGKVTAHKKGNAVITVKSEDGGKSAICEVRVSEKTYHVEQIILDKTSIELIEGEEATLSATIIPDNAINKNITWASNNNDVATVVDGKVMAHKKGNAVITVKSEDGGITATCNVTVNVKPIPVESISLSKAEAVLTEGDSITLEAEIYPENATNKNMVWTSSDNTVATVTNGKVNAIKVGNSTITVTTEDGNRTATCNITVKSIGVDGGIEGTEDIWYVK
ncbi:MAG: Ig domain-containing protein [Bacteroidales bacterium]|nr:Ig domain-containing protein [Bacteroidales bacterium]